LRTLRGGKTTAVALEGLDLASLLLDAVDEVDSVKVVDTEES
jgi:hypothetical protein